MVGFAQLMAANYNANNGTTIGKGAPGYQEARNLALRNLARSNTQGTGQLPTGGNNNAGQSADQPTYNKNQSNASGGSNYTLRDYLEHRNRIGLGGHNERSVYAGDGKGGTPRRGNVAQTQQSATTAMSNLYQQILNNPNLPGQAVRTNPGGLMARIYGSMPNRYGNRVASISSEAGYPVERLRQYYQSGTYNQIPRYGTGRFYNSGWGDI